MRRKSARDLSVAHLPPQTIGAKQYCVTGSNDDWFCRGVRHDGVADAYGSDQHVFLRMIFRIFGTYYALLNKARYQRVIVGELAKIALVQEVEAAVSDVCIIKMRSNQREGGQGRAHSAKKRILKCVLLTRMLASAKP